MVQGMVSRPFALRTEPLWLVARFIGPADWNILGWTIVNGGFQRVPGVAWRYLGENEIADVEDPREWMKAQMRLAGYSAHAGFLTTRREHRYVEAASCVEEYRCWAVATVGLSNALRAGDPPGMGQAAPSTINLLVVSSHPVTTEGSLELSALTSEAKALAVLDSGYRSKRSGQPATGTGTDCLVLAWPTATDDARENYCGKHTALGSAVGLAAYRAVSEGIRIWREEQTA